MKPFGSRSLVLLVAFLTGALAAPALAEVTRGDVDDARETLRQVRERLADEAAAYQAPVSDEGARRAFDQQRTLVEEAVADQEAIRLELERLVTLIYGELEAANEEYQTVRAEWDVQEAERLRLEEEARELREFLGTSTTTTRPPTTTTRPSPPTTRPTATTSPATTAPPATTGPTATTAPPATTAP